MVKTFRDFNEILELRDKLNEIHFILRDEGVSYLTIDYPNREFRFPGIPGKDLIKYCPFRIRLIITSEITQGTALSIARAIKELFNSDFFDEWLDRAKEFCGEKISIYTTSSTDFYPIIYFYYN